MSQPQERCCFDDWAKHDVKRARRRGVAAGVTRRLLTELEAAGLTGRTVLDVGCGVGDLALNSLRRGAARATGIDLSGENIAQARRLAEERELSDRVAFSTGDGASAPLEPHDVVVLNRVFCCYPDIDLLLGNSLPAARSVYAFTTPPSDGFAGTLARLLTRLGNAWFRLRRSKYGDFRSFVHDLNAIDAKVKSAGFRPLVGRRGVIWHLAVYARNGQP